MMTVTNDIITTGEAARLLGVTIPTMRRYAAAGRLPYTRLPTGHYRFLRLDVLALRMIPPQSPTQPGRPPKFGKLEVTP